MSGSVFKFPSGGGVSGVVSGPLFGPVIVQEATAANSVTITGAATGARPSILATGTDTNISLVVGPKGTGALIAQMPDNAATGGNARGANAVDFQTIRTAASNVASGNYSAVVGGFDNTSGGNSAFTGGGYFNSSSGANSVVSGGQANTSSGTMSWIPGGISATTRGHYGRGAWAAGLFATAGDAQSGEYVLRRQTTDATATRLTADNAAAGSANTINLPNFAAYTGRLLVSAKVVGATDAANWLLDLGAVRGNGVGTVVLYLGANASLAPTGSNGTNGALLRLTTAADTTNGGIAISVTGIAATTINWVARFLDVETVTAS